MPALKKKSINLIVREDADKSFTNQLLTWAITYGRYIIILVQITVLTVFFLRFKLDRDHTDLKEAVSQKQALIQSVTDLEKEIRRVQKQLSDIKTLTSGQNYFQQILFYLEENTPTDTKYLSITLAKDMLIFTAVSENLKSFNILLRSLQTGNKFSDIVLEDIYRRGDGRIEFKIQTRINPKIFSL